MTTLQYLQTQMETWLRYRDWEELCYKVSEQPVLTLTSNTSEIIFSSSQPHPTNCPNCGAPLKTGLCEYCDSRIY